MASGKPGAVQIQGERADCLVLRSSAFDECETTEEVHRTAKQLFSTLNVAMANNAGTNQISAGAVFEFLPEGPPRRHHFLEAKGISAQARVGLARLTVRDAEGNVIEPTPAPSNAQLWVRAATLEPDIGNALRYLEGEPSWFDLYKAYEAIRRFPSGLISRSEIRRFTQSANVGERHHANNTHQPHKRPMDLREARAFVMRWVSFAINDTLAKNS
jgi:hypothetical protein